MRQQIRIAGRKTLRKLENKVVIVTGASSGIGAAIARLFAAEGASLALASRAIDKLESLASELGPRAVAIETDVTDPAQIQEMTRRCVERFGRIDILVNNAGVGMYGGIAEIPLARLQQLIATNWLGPIHAIQTVVPHMRRQGGGQIINVSSIAGKVVIPWMTAYAGTKFALNALSDGLRMELKQDRIEVINVCPGRIRTPFPDNAFKNPSAQSFHPGGISPGAGGESRSAGFPARLPGNCCPRIQPRALVDAQPASPPAGLDDDPRSASSHTKKLN